LKELHKRVVVAQQEADKELLDGLRSRGFGITTGEDGSGFLMLAWSRAGGYYLDVGASQYVIDGKIKLKPGQGVRAFTEDRVVLEDGTELEADVVVFATGYGDMRQTVRKAMGDAVADHCKPIWGLDLEREIRGVWAGSGVPHFWIMLGNLALCRFNSKLMALQIKAQLDGVFTEQDRCEL